MALLMVWTEGRGLNCFVFRYSGTMSFADEQTKAAMRKVYREKKYVLDPHGAIGYLGLKEYLQKEGSVTGIFLETAHPSKFQDVVSSALGETIPLPSTLEKFMKGKKSTTPMSSKFEDFKDFLLK